MGHNHGTHRNTLFLLTKDSIEVGGLSGLFFQEPSIPKGFTKNPFEILDFQPKGASLDLSYCFG